MKQLMLIACAVVLVLVPIASASACDGDQLPTGGNGWTVNADVGIGGTLSVAGNTITFTKEGGDETTFGWNADTCKYDRNGTKTGESVEFERVSDDKYEYEKTDASGTVIGSGTITKI